MRLHGLDMAIRRIALTMGLDRRTVRTFVHAGSFPERAARTTVPTEVDRYRPYLEQRLHEGCINATQLWRELARQGYGGCYRTVQRAVWQLRPQARASPGMADRRTRLAAIPVPTPRRACTWLLGWAVRPTKDEPDAAARGRFMQRLCAAVPAIDQARHAVRDFQRILRDRDVPAFERWLASVRTSSVAELHRFAAGLAADREAVRAAVATDWSNGKGSKDKSTASSCPKRQMYGRAKLDLLRVRLLGTA